MKKAKLPSRVIFFACLVSMILYTLPAPRFISTGDLATAIWCGTVIAWIVRVRFHIVEKHIRRHLVAGGVMMVLLLVFRVIRYNVSSVYPVFARYLWYGYYIPFTVLPVLALIMALCVGLADDESFMRFRSFRITLWTLAGVWLVILFTNDLHGLFLDFEGIHAYGRFDNGIYGILQYPFIAWMVGLSIASFVIIMRRCRVSGSMKKWYVPALVFIFGNILFAVYFLKGGHSPQIYGESLYQIQEVCIIIFMGTCEACILIGLIPSNSGYRAILENSDWNVTVTGTDGIKIFASENMGNVSSDEILKARNGPLRIGEGRVLTTFDIRGGYAGWVADVEYLERLNNELRESNQELENENEVIRKGEELRLKRFAFETQNRLYDSIIPAVTPELSRVRDLLAEPDDAKLFEAAMLMVYVKRRFNLGIVTSNTDIAEMNELFLAVREMTEVLQDRGIQVFVTPCVNTDVRADMLISVFDFFADIVIRSLAGLHSVFANISVTDGNPGIRVLIGSEEDITFPAPYIEKLRRLGGTVTKEYEDGTGALGLFFTEGGDGDG